MSILIIGGGKMGISHLALTSTYVQKKNIILCEIKFTTRIFFKILGYKTFKSLNDIERSGTEIKGVIISTPTSSHAFLMKWALSKKIPFLVEKPMTLNAELSSSILKLANELKVYGQVGFVMRYVKSFQNARELVSRDIFGSFVTYTLRMSGNVVSAPLPKESWLGDFSRGGGCLNEYGPHILDMSLFLFGGVTKILNASCERIYSANADDRVSIELEHDGGKHGRVEINWADNTKRKSIMELTIIFEKCKIVVDNSSLNIIDSQDGSIDGSVVEMFSARVPENVKFYLRGEEYSLQIEDFLTRCYGYSFFQNSSERISSCTPLLSDGVRVDQLISDIALKAGLRS